MSLSIMLLGAGQMGTSALSILARSLPDAQFTIVDRSPDSLRLGAAVAPNRILTRQLDILRDGLDATGADLVVNFAGPFFLGSDTAARAAIAAGAAYVDVCDDAEGTRTILQIDDLAKKSRSAGDHRRWSFAWGLELDCQQSARHPSGIEWDQDCLDHARS